MIMIGGVSLLAIIVIIVGLQTMEHKKKVDASPMIVNTTRGQIVVPATTPVSTMPATTMPREKKNYILSVDGDYLIFNEGGVVSSTSDYTKATPISLGTIPYNNTEYYSILTEAGKYISLGSTGIVYTDSLGNGGNGSNSLVLMSSTYPADIYAWGSSVNLQKSLTLDSAPIMHGVLFTFKE
jgi:hypothetical protein